MATTNTTENEIRTDVDVMRALLEGEIGMSDFEVSTEHGFAHLQLVYKTSEADVYLQVEPFAVQSYDKSDADESRMADFTWDELVGDRHGRYWNETESVEKFLEARRETGLAPREGWTDEGEHPDDSSELSCRGYFVHEETGVELTLWSKIDDDRNRTYLLRLTEEDETLLEEEFDWGADAGEAAFDVMESW